MLREKDKKEKEDDLGSMGLTEGALCPVYQPLPFLVEFWWPERLELLRTGGSYALLRKTYLITADIQHGLWQKE